MGLGQARAWWVEGLGSGIRQPWVRTPTGSGLCDRGQQSSPFEPLKGIKPVARGPGLCKDTVSCCMCGLHVASRCGCGSGQSLSPGLLIGMTGVALVTGLHSRLQNTAGELHARCF